MKKLLSTLIGVLIASTMQAQYQEPVRRDTSRLQPLKGLEYKVEPCQRANTALAQCQ